jgi:hypothetical protein
MLACARGPDQRELAEPDQWWAGCYALTQSPWVGDLEVAFGAALGDAVQLLQDAAQQTSPFNNGPTPYHTRPLHARVGNAEAEWWIDRPYTIVVNTPALSGVALYLVPVSDTLLSGSAVAYSDMLRGTREAMVPRLAQAHIDARRVGCDAP